MRVSSRRDCLAMLISAMCALKAVAEEEQRASADESSQGWMAEDTPLRQPIPLQKFPDGWYVVTEPIVWHPKANSKGTTSIVVPAGFVTDLAIVPSIVRGALSSPDGPYALAAVVLDWIYWEQRISREEADTAFNDIMMELNVDTVKRHTLHAAVRWNGSRAWEDARAKKRFLGTRVLKRWPNDPNITWEKWKRIPGVFQQ